MEFYFAPLEGISGYIYRNAYHRYFNQIDKYFIPFIMPNQFGRFSSKEKNDIMPEHNRGMYAVPQILTNSAEDFLRTAYKLNKRYGYQEVNLNLGCPSKTVVTKGRGAGFLAYPEKLDQFLREIFANSDMEISVKTRIGMENPAEFKGLLEIYNQYPLKELIIHPRLQTDMYRNTPNWEVFGEALKCCNCKVCYNGDIFTVKDYERFVQTFPNVQSIMLGRGLLSNPGLLCAIRQGGGLRKQTLRAFHDQILENYREVLSGDRTVLFKMKELWFYLAPLFTESEKYAKRIRKSEKLVVYEAVVDALFKEQEIDCAIGGIESDKDLINSQPHKNQTGDDICRSV